MSSSCLLTLLLLCAPDDPTGPVEALWHASKRGDVAAVRALIEQGVDIDARTEFDATAIYFAASNDHAAVCAVLAEAGAELDVADSFYGNTPIGMAGWLGYPAPVRVLIENGSEQGLGAMFAAVANNHVGVVEAVVESMDVPQGVLDSAWRQAIGSAFYGVAEVLEAAGANVDPLAFPEEAEAPTTTGDARPKVEDPYTPVIEPRPWPRFRGPDGSGVADGQHPPLSWDVPSGEHVRWRTAVPGLGHSSPIVWGNRVYVTTAVGERSHTGIDQLDGELDRGWIGAAQEDFTHRFELHAYRLSDGEPVWRRLCREGVPRAERHWKSSHASCTVAVDEEHVVAFFGSEGLYCFDHEGELLWQKDLGVLDAGWFVDDSFGWGFASSPILWNGRLFVQCDVSGADFVAAFDAATGEELWRAARDELPAWGTPVVAAGPEGPELVLNATNAILSYDAETGEERWGISGNSKITVASPVVADGVAYVTGGYQRPAPIYAVQLGSVGDLTLDAGTTSSAAILWSSQRDGVYQPTPLVYEELLYMLRSNGVLTCYVAETGEELWRERLASRGSAHTASPIAADGYLYIADENGEVYVVRAGDEFELVTVNDLGGRCLTTPAVSNGVIVFRTLEELVALAHR